MVLLIVLSNAITFAATGASYRRNAVPLPEVPSTNEKVTTEELKSFVEVLTILSERYLKDVTREELINAAIKGMVESLDDPQTSFLEPSDWQEMMVKIDGSFSGIGVEINSVNDYITIVSPIKDTPGERAGLLAGDRIIAVDGKDIVGITTTEAVKLMRGVEGTKVTLLVERTGVAENLTFEITRGNIVVPSVISEMKANKIGYIQITTFDDHVGKDVQEALLVLETQGMRGLIIDLRDNPGGLLSEAVKIGQELLPAGPITRVVDGEGKVMQTYQSYGKKKEYPMVLLVNGGSASASEIIAGAFQDTASGTLIGTKTYGKATVQHLEGLTNSAGLRYTVAKYQTPNGRDIHGVGLEPDILVELPKEFFMIQHRIVSELKPGDEGTSVLFLQNMLMALKYNVTETSTYDEATKLAVSSFQTKNGLPVTGVLDQATRTTLATLLDAEIIRLDTQMQKATEQIMQQLQ